MCRNRCPGLLIKFQRTDHAFDVVCMDVFCRLRIDSPKHTVQRLHSLLSCQSFIFFTQGTIRIFRCKIYIIEQGLNIKSGTTHNKRQFVLLPHPFHRCLCIVLELYNMEFLIRLIHIDQCMIDTLHLLGHDLGRSDIHVLIHLHGIC